MFKFASVIATTLILLGCTSTSKPEPYKATQSNRESMLVQSKNHGQLIELYKNQLRSQEDSETRIKLANVYLNDGDAESAIFIIEDLPTLESDWQALKIQAKAKYQVLDIDGAMKATQKAINLHPKDGELHNMLGVLQSEMADFSAAEQSLNQARRYFYDDVKVKNNLAAVYMLQGNYDRAVTLLSLLYHNAPEDEIIRSNFIIALVKSNNSAQAKLVLKQHYKRDDLDEALQAIEESSKITRSGHSIPLESLYEY